MLKNVLKFINLCEESGKFTEAQIGQMHKIYKATSPQDKVAISEEYSRKMQVIKKACELSGLSYKSVWKSEDLSQGLAYQIINQCDGNGNPSCLSPKTSRKVDRLLERIKDGKISI